MDICKVQDNISETYQNSGKQNCLHKHGFFQVYVHLHMHTTHKINFEFRHSIVKINFINVSPSSS
jgi:hypothetical protein